MKLSHQNKTCGGSSPCLGNLNTAKNSPKQCMMWRPKVPTPLPLTWRLEEENHWFVLPLVLADTPITLSVIHNRYITLKMCKRIPCPFFIHLVTFQHFSWSKNQGSFQVDFLTYILDYFEAVVNIFLQNILHKSYSYSSLISFFFMFYVDFNGHLMIQKLV